MDSAFYYYDLTDVIPAKIYVATNSKSNVITNKKIVQPWVSKEKLNIGKDEIIIDGEKV